MNGTEVEGVTDAQRQRFARLFGLSAAELSAMSREQLDRLVAMAEAQRAEYVAMGYELDEDSEAA